jgi:alpha-N-acetylglucosaminidase
VEEEVVRQDLIRFAGRASLLGLLVAAPAGYAGTAPAQDSGLAAARKVLERSFGSGAASFDLVLDPTLDTLDSFEVGAAGGRVHVRATSPVALVRGAYHFLRSTSRGMISWSGSRVDLPAVIPDRPAVRVASPYRFRQYLNICAFGYSTPFWDWARWEKEIDWMALHGVNMPLAMAGQMSVWQRVWESFGIPRDSLKDFFVGPAFLPWHWMGNIDRHEGPMPQAFIDRQEELQKKILARMRELGMTPIVPAFSGFVPEPFRRRFPSEKVFEHRLWSKLPEENRSFALIPGSPVFQQIGERFIKEYRRTFGPATYYLADSFNELDVPVSAEHRYEELAGYGEAVYESIRRGDPDGVWVMQGWLFNNAAKFWDTTSTHALLSRVPDDRMIIVDLANEEFHGWKVQKSFYGKQWFYSIIHNFGGNTPLRGNIRIYASDPTIAVNDPTRGRLVGFGMSPEGIENNEAVYELLSDMGWRREAADLESWLHDYASARYGSTNPNVDRAWQLIRDAAYSGTRSHRGRFGFQWRPALQVASELFDDPRMEEALDLMLGEAGKFTGSSLYTSDLVDVACYAVGNRIDRTLAAATRAHVEGSAARRDSLAEAADLMMRQLDGILNIRPDLRLERWISTARARGTTAEEQALMERNARRQVTVWGGPDLHEYASKVWSGLVRDYYAPRWRLFFSLLREGAEQKAIQERIRDWDEQWGLHTTLSAPLSVGVVAAAVKNVGRR